MATYIKLSNNQYPMHQGDIRLEVDNIGEPFVCPEGYALVQDTPVPEYTEYQYLFEDLPIQQNGIWVKQFRIVDMTAEEAAAWDAEKEKIRLANKAMLDPSINNSGSAPDVIE